MVEGESRIIDPGTRTAEILGRVVKLETKTEQIQFQPHIYVHPIGVRVNYTYMYTLLVYEYASSPLSFFSVTNSSLTLDKVGTTRIQTAQGVLQLGEAYLSAQSPVSILSLA